MGSGPSKPLTLEDELKACVTDGQIDHEKLQAVLKRWEEARCDIAILGASGSGKSTLINNLLDVPRLETDESIEQVKEQIAKCDHTNPVKCRHSYAPTDSEECTSIPTPYSMGASSAYLWDLPGFGAEKYPDVATYWQQLGIEKYSAFLCVFRDNRVREQDKEVVKFLLEGGKHVIWVRTYFDASILGKKDVATEKDKAVKFIRNLGVQDPKVYCVSGAYIPHDKTTIQYLYELDHLKPAIMDSVPDALKMPLAETFKGCSETLIQAKFEAIKERIMLYILAGTAYTLKRRIPAIFGFTEAGEIATNVCIDEQVRIAIKNKISSRISKGGDLPVFMKIPYFSVCVALCRKPDVKSDFLKLSADCRDCALEVVRILREQHLNA